MVVAPGDRGLVARDPVAGADVLHEPQLRQRLERAIDGCGADRTPRFPEPVVDLLGAQAAARRRHGPVDARGHCDGLPRLHRRRRSDALAPLIGAVIGSLVSISERGLAYFLALYAGFFLSMGATDLLPEAHSHPSWKRVGLTIAGFAITFVIARAVT
jgi:hypothetical protein